MTQQTFLDMAQYTGRVINVASVPHRSLFRYPGGKTWLVPYIRAWLRSLPVPPSEFVEPFAGGAIVGLTVAAEQLAAHVTLIELDSDVAAVWQTLFGTLEGGAWLAAQIAAFDLTLENVRAALTPPATEIRARAFQTILRNRCNRGGILSQGAGLINAGENGKGIASRWYPETLQQRIHALVALRPRVTFVQGDALPLLAAHAEDAGRAYFIDPPYSAGGKRAGSRLYNHNTLDHAALFAQVAALAGPFLMTYDDAPEVRALAAAHDFAVQNVAMKNTHHATMRELVISRDLGWLHPVL